MPGWLRDKVVATLRGLPKELRRSLVPIPDAADRFLAEAGRHTDESLAASLAAFVTAECGTPVTQETIAAIALPPWLRMNIRVIDEAGRVMRSGRDLGELRRVLGSVEPAAIAGTVETWRRSGIRRWDFGVIPSEVVVTTGGVRLAMHPTVEDRTDSVSLGAAS